MPQVTKLSTELTPEKIPFCGIPLGGRLGYIFLGGKAGSWYSRVANHPNEYVNVAFCGIDRYNNERRCERCMKAVGVIW